MQSSLGRLAELHVRGAKDGKDFFLRIAQMTQQKLAAARFRQRELHAGMNGADVVQEEWGLWHLQDVLVACRGKLHSECLVNSEVGDVHVLDSSGRPALPLRSRWLRS